jgi:hypothetical protein
MSNVQPGSVDSIRAQELKGNDRLRWSLGRQVMTTLKKAARKERAGRVEQSALFSK